MSQFRVTSRTVWKLDFRHQPAQHVDRFWLSIPKRNPANPSAVRMISTQQNVYLCMRDGRRTIGCTEVAVSVFWCCHSLFSATRLSVALCGRRIAYPVDLLAQYAPLMLWMLTRCLLVRAVVPSEKRFRRNQERRKLLLQFVVWPHCRRSRSATLQFQ